MKTIDPGYRYALVNYDNYPQQQGLEQQLLFVKREDENYPGNKGTNPGTNCQEVLRALIDRCVYLQKQKSCAETEAIIGNLRSALLLFELRAARRHGRHLDFSYLETIEIAGTCETCGHVDCQGHEE